MTLNFHFFTPTPFTYRGYFSLDKRFGNGISLETFTIKRGASQQLKQVISEGMGEKKKKKLFTSKGSVCIAKNCDIVLEKAAISRPRSQFFPIRTSQLANNVLF